MVGHVVWPVMRVGGPIPSGKATGEAQRRAVSLSTLSCYTDCPACTATVFVPELERPVDLQRIRGKPMNEADIARLLRDVTAAPLGQHEPIDDLRLSIAGTQEKTALLWHDASR